MNQNISFTKRESFVDIFKIDDIDNLPVGFEWIAAVSVIDATTGHVVTVNCLSINEQTVDVREKDYIVIEPCILYNDGNCKVGQTVYAINSEALRSTFQAWDEGTEEYVDITEAFNPVLLDEPTDAEIRTLDAKLNRNQLINQANRDIQDILEGEELFI